MSKERGRDPPARMIRDPSRVIRNVNHDDDGDDDDKRQEDQTIQNTTTETTKRGHHPREFEHSTAPLFPPVVVPVHGGGGPSFQEHEPHLADFQIRSTPHEAK
jgi:hypothetical protein